MLSTLAASMLGSDICLLKGCRILHLRSRTRSQTWLLLLQNSCAHFLLGQNHLFTNYARAWNTTTASFRYNSRCLPRWIHISCRISIEHFLDGLILFGQLMRFDTCSSDSTKYLLVFFWYLLFGLRCSMILLDYEIFWPSHGTWESRLISNALRSPNFWLLFASLRLQIKTFGSYRRCSRAFSTHDFLQLVHVHSMFAFTCGRYLLSRIIWTTLVKFIVTLGLVKVTQTHRGLFIHLVYVICI